MTIVEEKKLWNGLKYSYHRSLRRTLVLHFNEAANKITNLSTIYCESDSFLVPGVTQIQPLGATLEQSFIIKTIEIEETSTDVDCCSICSYSMRWPEGYCL